MRSRAVSSLFSHSNVIIVLMTLCNIYDGLSNRLDCDCVCVFLCCLYFKFDCCVYLCTVCFSIVLLTVVLHKNCLSVWNKLPFSVATQGMAMCKSQEVMNVCSLPFPPIILYYKTKHVFDIGSLIVINFVHSVLHFLFKIISSIP